MKLVYCLMIVLLYGSASHAKQMDVFTNDAYGANSLQAAVSQGWDVQLHNMDAYLKLKNHLSYERAKTRSQAIALAKRNIGVLSAQELRSSLRGPIKALKYGIKKVPAVVFNDGESVVYGITDIDIALNLYAQWSRKKAREKSNDR